ncbi:hypothetical protein EMIT074MI3_11817 [Bacillus licheniformis]|nr:hypothetical protein CHCC15087_1870 [Bacillus licheniformis]TWM62068.1 hypothetical protein CHCC14813_0385 [Bacillus licheniformis]TWM99013.1 hypothetical protein CHCC14596_3541 [Bacillus licheniformis]TWN32847.1 hypothetical protein CHCC14525_0012 [Bacillus licheniformis]TWO12904.1 hypothetical protein CHCC14431_0078 [Bacillus licheniformis]
MKVSKGLIEKGLGRNVKEMASDVAVHYFGARFSRVRRTVYINAAAGGRGG